MKRFVLRLLCLLPALGLWQCNGKSVVTDVVIEEQSYDISVGEELQLTASVFPEDAPERLSYGPRRTNPSQAWTLTAP